MGARWLETRDVLNDLEGLASRAVLRAVKGLPDGIAHEAEAAVRSALADAGEKPLRGREYFNISCLATILDVADSWLPAQDIAA